MPSFAWTSKEGLVTTVMNSAVPFLDYQVDGFGRFLNREFFFCALSIHGRGMGKGMERVDVGRGALFALHQGTGLPQWLRQ